MSVSPAPCPPSELLERIALGESAPTELRDHLAACDACRGALERIRDDNRFLSEFAVAGTLPIPPPIPVVGEIEIAGYVILREIHRGGQGVVYQARQRSTKRDVAIKVIRQGAFATQADRARFDREIETLGRLNHPNIVAVHDAGTVAGHNYFVMNYIDGQSLDEAVRRPGLDLLEVFIEVCEAVHAAHLRGVIHRDLKPSNIRVDHEGRPHVLDFGLAKSVDGEAESAMTRTGQFVGSLPWASPEQVEGASARIDLRTDVYSLGAILFQLLTGRLPFDVGSNLRDALDDILTRAPPRPSACSPPGKQRRIDDELDTIVLRCLAKDPQRRYQSAGELARDLRRHRAGEPIEAKRDSAVYLLRRALHRYRRRVAAAAAFAALLVVFSVVMTLLYGRAARLEREASRSAASLAEQLSQSNIGSGRMAGMLGNLQLAERLLWHELLVASAPGEGAAARLNDPPGPPQAWWALWELYRRRPCARTLSMQPSIMHTATISADGQGLWTVDTDGRVELLDEFGARLDEWRIAPRRSPGITWVSACGRVILCGGGAAPTAWRRDVAAGPVVTLRQAPDAPDGSVRLSRSGRLLAAVVVGAVEVWSTDPPDTQLRIPDPENRYTVVALSHDDALLALRDRSGGIEIRRIASSEMIASAPGDGQRATHTGGELLFSPDGRLLADAWLETPGRVWDLRGECVRINEECRMKSAEQHERGARPAPSPPASISAFCIHHSAFHPPAVELSDRPATHRVQDFSPDGRLLAVGDLGGLLRIFDTHTGRRLMMVTAHRGRVYRVCFTADGRGVWTCGENEMRLWEVTADAGVAILTPDDNALHGVDISPDGRWLLSGGGGAMFRVEIGPAAPRAGAIAGPDWQTSLCTPPIAGTISSVAVSPDGHRIAAASHSNAAFLWDRSGLHAALHVLSHPDRVSCIVFCDDGRHVATACDDGAVRTWSAADGSLLSAWPITRQRIPQIAYCASGDRLAAVTRDGALLARSAAGGEWETWRPRTGAPLRAVRFAPDGRWLAAAGAERTVSIWDVATRRPLAEMAGHDQEIYALDVSPDGSLIASGDAGGAVWLWHAGLRRPLATLEGHSGSVMALRFSPDGRSLLTAALDGTLRRWDFGHYERHIAGQVDAQLRRTGLDAADPVRAAAWRDWATAILRHARQE